MTVQALVKAEGAMEWDNDADTHAIFQATRAVLFFGTPHRGLPTDDILSMIDTKNNAERAKLVRSIGVGSPVLAAELGKFAHIADNFKLFSFYERQKTKSIVLVRAPPPPPPLSPFPASF